MKVLIKVRYDGSAFCGSQVQPGLPTVQGTLTVACGEVFGFDCDVTGCSRTDSGVHALSYCATVSPTQTGTYRNDWCPVPVGKIPRALNSKLSPSVAVIGACYVDDSFHPRYDVVSKEYRYLINDSAVRDPLLIGRAWQTGRPITDVGLDMMRSACAYFIGKHDFRAFMASGSAISDTVRDVGSLSARRREDGLIEILISADGFLYNMVRIIAGTLVSVGYGRIKPADIPGIIASGDRAAAGQTAPAEGLYLSDVKYKEPLNWMLE